MSRRHAVAATGVVLVGTMLIAACGTNRSEGDAAGSSCDTSKGTLRKAMTRIDCHAARWMPLLLMKARARPSSCRGSEVC